MVEKIFQKDPYMKEAEATVEKVDGNKVFLDRTIFFAFSGGQASDSGEISGVKVTDVQEYGGNIAHVVKEQKFSAGDKVTLKLDWERRYNLMKLHAAAHIVYYLTIEKIGEHKIIGSNIHVNKARFDFEYGESISPLLPEIEKKANDLIAKGMEITTTNDPDEPGKRWWKCGEWKMPCGGTHVKDLRELGKIELKRINIGSGKERIEIILS